jgi:tight adherence protein C
VNVLRDGLIQSATFGTSIAMRFASMRREMRDKRVMRAEEKANMLPTKLTLATMMFTVPPLLHHSDRALDLRHLYKPSGANI